MELRRGLIRDELELKAYILYILKHFYDPIPFEVLNDLALDRVANYFEFVNALGDLVKNGLVSEQSPDRTYLITVKGRFTLQAVETNLPYSTRLHTSEDIQKYIAKTRRDSSIVTSIESEGNQHKVRMELFADHGPILKLELLAADRGNAEELVSKFRTNAEKIYLTLIDELTKTDSKEQ